MKFRCERDTLLDAVTTAQRAVASRAGALPVLSGLRVVAENDRVELVGSDLELTIRVSAPADVETDGRAVVPAKLLSDIVARLDDGRVSVDVDSNNARITGGRASFSLRLLPLDDFPRLPEVSGDTVRLEAGPFAEALRQVIPAASRDDARVILTGVLIASTPGGLRLVATDSYRLAVRDLAGLSMLADRPRVLVGAKALTEVQRLLGDGEIEVTLGEREAKFSGARGEVTTRLIDGDFPNYEQLIPSGYPNRCTVAREALGDAVRRMQLVGQNLDSSPVRVAMSHGGVELSANAQDVGEAREALEAKYESDSGEDLAVAFNARFLLDGISALAGSEVILETVDPLKPATLRAAEQSDFLYLLMPVRIS